MHYALGLDCARGNLLFPIRLPGLELDAYFFSDPFDERTILYQSEHPPEEYFSPGDGGTEPLQWMEAAPPCGIRLGHAANIQGIQGDNREEAVLLADECVDDGHYGVFAHTPNGDLSLSDAAVRLGSVSLPAPPLSWMVLTSTNDGEHERFVVAGTGYAMLLSFEGGGSPFASDSTLTPFRFNSPTRTAPSSDSRWAIETAGAAIETSIEEGAKVVKLRRRPEPQGGRRARNARRRADGGAGG